MARANSVDAGAACARGSHHSIPALDGTPTDPELTGDGVDLPPLLFEDLQPRIATHPQRTPLVLSPLLATDAAET